MKAGSQIRDYKKRTLGVLIIINHSWPAGSQSNVYLTALNSLCFACSNLCAFALIAQGEIITVYERLSIIHQLKRKKKRNSVTGKIWLFCRLCDKPFLAVAVLHKKITVVRHPGCYISKEFKSHGFLNTS